MKPGAGFGQTYEGALGHQRAADPEYVAVVTNETRTCRPGSAAGMETSWKSCRQTSNERSSC
jgi:hypothetical protein